MRLPKPKSMAFHPILIVILLAVLSGCSSLPEVKLEDPDPKQRNVGLVYGYLDMDDTLSTYYYWIVGRRYRPSAKEYKMYVYQSGLFYHLGLDMGSHQVVRLGSTQNVYRFDPNIKNQTAIKIKKPGLHYMGSFKYAFHEGKGYFDKNKFSIKRTNSPSEKELLIKLLKIMQDEHSDHTTQIGWIKKRLKQL